MVFPHKEFEKTSCKDANIEKGYLADMFDYIEKHQLRIHSMLLVKDGAKVFDAYKKGFYPFHNENVYSISKSFTSIAIGICIDKGYVKLTDKVLPYFKDDVKEPLKGYEKLTIENLLTMTTGQKEDIANVMIRNKDANPYESFFTTELDSEPGQYFKYNSGATFILSAIVTKVTNLSLNDFLDQVLYSKIGIEKPYWESIGLVNYGGTGLHINTIDLAKFGLLLLNEGVWRDERIVSAEYIKNATKSHIETPDCGNEADRYGYGFQFWMNEFGGFRAAGLFKQYIVVDPENQTVFVTQADEDSELLDLYSNFILPALQKGWLYDNVSLRFYTRRFEGRELEEL